MATDGVKIIDGDLAHDTYESVSYTHLRAHET